MKILLTSDITADHKKVYFLLTHAVEFAKRNPKQSIATKAFFHEEVNV